MGDCIHNNIPKWCFYCLQERVAELEKEVCNRQISCHDYALREMDYEKTIEEQKKEIDVLTKALQKAHLKMAESNE